MKISDRIAEFIQAKGMSIRALEQTIGCSNGLLGRCINKKTEISSQWISKIIEAFPDVSSEWFMTGKGAMFKDSSDEFRINPI
ncbi:helix-turn-helix transcriptional regulator, partial [uncultured Muribaculum sp.]|uniref:helix-turn-helix domain-containing protein n=1 Tax=uncultured Muribaculum sp. TaxID=1918613 RepID=UPI0025B34B8B